MDHQALYRQFRPETFSDLVGQEAIVTALKNQVINNKTAHAYLFCGTRGTGKTTTARILSRAVNCLNPKNGEPCNECEACRNIMDSTAIDVVEIDAASNTSVDNVRQIREEVVYPPMSLNKKVYIIDEVHMLSGGAFNALLKTLEEPPEYVIFILATTESHKVPATILSRCQRFDFKRISGAVIGERLKFVCAESGASFEDDAIAAVAYAADGSMRDGLSILEKCLSVTGDKLTAESVSMVLGTVDDKDLFAISTAISQKDAASAVAVCEKAIAEGRDPLLLTTYLMEHFRCIMVAALVKNPGEILQMNQERTRAFALEGQKFALPQIITILKSLTNVYKSQKETPNPKMMLEIGLAAICTHGTKQTAAPAVHVAPYRQEISPAVQPPAEAKVNIQPAAETYVQSAPVQENPAPAAEHEEIMEFPEDEPEEQKPVMDEKHGSLTELSEKWGDILEYLVREKKAPLCANLRLCRPVVESEDTIMLIFRPENKINLDMVEKPQNKESLQEAIWQYIGIRPKIHCCFNNESAAKATQINPVGGLDALADEFGDFIKIED